MALLVLSACRQAPESTEPTANAVVSQALGRGEIVLDRAASGAALLGAPRPVLPDTDAPRALALRWVAANGAEVALAGPLVVEDARFFPNGSGVVAVRQGGDLVVIDADASHEAPRVVDHEAHAPLSVATAASVVAYARGPMPDLEIATFDRQRTEARAITIGQAPCWSPALRADGQAVIYVSAISGFPEIYVTGQDARPQRLSRRVEGHAVPFPSEPRAPVWVGDEHTGSLRFADEAGAHTLELASLASRSGGAR